MCEHEWISSEIAMQNEGYMIMKYCIKCRDVNGSGFINKQHEIAYLESLLKEEA